MLLLGELLGMKSSRGEERNSESEFHFISVMDKCGNRESKKLANHLRITVFCLSKVVKNV